MFASDHRGAPVDAPACPRASHRAVGAQARTTNQNFSSYLREPCKKLHEITLLYWGDFIFSYTRGKQDTLSIIAT